MKQLGVIRICVSGAVFEIPYFNESEFQRLVFATRANDVFYEHGIFAPYRAIDWMVQVPEGATQTVDDQTTGGEFGGGQTRQ